ncbi:START-like domain [Plasmopara halstedii]|uniref:START-like domain n=1 Tax=Plasmopara halstedii TaxID=4781 RepID=A0A0P1B732_PLAHL|nr:START-like domain [Plasmopara halstedii]CEG49482.1 START-like domain [Plasmopara halstedii]|eukprot:XP_024585851.1 START-like domain [Plasmopara halstedii]
MFTIGLLHTMIVWINRDLHYYLMYELPALFDRIDSLAADNFVVFVIISMASFVKWIEIDIPGASTRLIHNRDYVFVEASGILCLKNGERVGYHIYHSVNFPQTPDLPHRVRGNMSFSCIFRQENDRTDCRGTRFMDPGGDMIRTMAVMGMVQATIAGSKYSYCGQMKKLTWLVEQNHKKEQVAHALTSSL